MLLFLGSLVSRCLHLGLFVIFTTDVIRVLPRASLLLKHLTLSLFVRDCCVEVGSRTRQTLELDVSDEDFLALRKIRLRDISLPRCASRCIVSTGRQDDVRQVVRFSFHLLNFHYF